MAPPASGNGPNSLVFWSGDDVAEVTPTRDDDDVHVVASNHDDAVGPNDHESMYVTLFERMRKVVLTSEPHLLSPVEHLCLKAYTELSYRAKYLLVRLALRKSGKWHRLDKLDGFYAELGPFIEEAIAELCCRGSTKAETDGNITADETEIIDLTLDSDDEGEGEREDEGDEQDLSFFAQDETNMTLPELLECLTVSEVRQLANQLKLRASQTRPALIAAIVHYSETQTQLVVPNGKMKGRAGKDARPSVQTRLSFVSARDELGVNPLKMMLLKTLRKCIRINPHILTLFHRLNLIFFRDTSLPTKILTPSLLARVKKRFYPPYTYARTSDVWRTREELVRFEKALQVEGEVESRLKTGGGFAAGSGRTPVISSGRMPPTPGRLGVNPPPKRAATPAGSGAGPSRIRIDKGKGKEKEVVEDYLDIEETESPRVKAARAVKAVFETVYGSWKDLVASQPEEDHTDEARRRRGLRRFECGHVYTRIVSKGAEALGILKEHAYELEVLEALLSQRRWRRGRRGEWYDRRALILTNHVRRWEEARQGLRQGLEDGDTHITYRLKLERRLTGLEKKLKIPGEYRCTDAGVLVRPGKILVEGIRVKPKAPSVAPNAGVKLNERETGKSVWVGRDGQELNVELLALQEYERHGYKGFHCEGRILTTLFGLLFWDILFAAIPGALETPWQSAPMDIAEDSFYHARRELIEARLAQIEKGGAGAILERTDEEHRERDTWCVGVRWDLFSRKELLEIVECIGGKPLSVICQTLAEDYAARTSGVPDLIVWKLEDRECRFVEVKGPGDTERENQKIWMDVLMRAGVTAEVCRVQEHGHVEKKKAKKKRKRKRKAEEDTINPDLMVADFEEEAPWEDDNEPYDMDVEPEPAEDEDIVIWESPKRPAEDNPPPPTPKRRRQVEVLIISPRRKN